MKKEVVPMNSESFEKLHKRVEVLDNVISGKITQIQAGVELGVKERQIRNLLRKYKENGEEGLVHGLTGKGGNHHIKSEDKDIIIDVIHQKDYEHCKPQFIDDKLKEIYKVRVSKETVRNIMMAENIRKSGTKKHHIHRIKRPRKNFYGEMSQFDGSYHKWLEDRGEESCLLLDIDDATGKIRYMKLADNEGYDSVAEFWKEDILMNGVPQSIYLDKFSTYKVNHPKAVRTKEVRTHFDKAMRKLGSYLISAYSPEAKGRVERCNRTLQERLVRELRLAKISTIAEANVFIKDIFIPKYNEQFAVEPNKIGNVCIKLTEKQKKNLDRIFAREQLRSLGNDYIIQYKTRFYQVQDSQMYTVYPKKQLLVAENIRGELHIYAGKTSEDKLVVFEEISKYTVKSNRAKYYGQKMKVEKERAKQAWEQRKQQNHEDSKKKQAQYKAKKLFEKL